MNLDDAKQRGLDAAAIVCEHVANNHAPVLRAERSEPEDDADSGWQFLCGTEEENWQNAQIWALHEVLAMDSTLRQYLEVPLGTVLCRSQVGAAWRIQDPQDPDRG